MNAPLQMPRPEAVTYPEDDGLPMSDNTGQYEYMVTIKGGLDALFHDDPNVFVAGNLLWYPVAGDNTIRQAPDVLAVFGRPKGFRGSYRQWEERGIAPQVVFDVFTAGTRMSVLRKYLFYRRYEVEEFYAYNPDDGDAVGYQREGDDLVEIAFMDGWRSPRLGVRFQRVGTDLELYGPDGRKFATYVELAQAEAKERAGKEQAQREAEQERQRADQADQAQRRTDAENAELRAKLKALGIDVNT